MNQMTALFLMAPAYGHLNRSFPVARQVQADGYSIVYGHFGSPELAQQIKQQGFGLHWMQTNSAYILKRADLFITHGGLNSVLEAILQHVPMLVYPLNTKWDLPGYAARVVAHGIGLQIDLASDTDAQLVQRIEQVLINKSVKESLKKLSKTLQEKDTHSVEQNDRSKEIFH